MTVMSCDCSSLHAGLLSSRRLPMLNNTKTTQSLWQVSWFFMWLYQSQLLLLAQGNRVAWSDCALKVPPALPSLLLSQGDGAWASIDRLQPPGWCAIPHLWCCGCVRWDRRPSYKIAAFLQAGLELDLPVIAWIVLTNSTCKARCHGSKGIHLCIHNNNLRQSPGAATDFVEAIRCPCRGVLNRSTWISNEVQSWSSVCDAYRRFGLDLLSSLPRWRTRVDLELLPNKVTWWIRAKPLNACAQSRLINHGLKLAGHISALQISSKNELHKHWKTRGRGGTLWWHLMLLALTCTFPDRDRSWGWFKVMAWIQ